MLNELYIVPFNVSLISVFSHPPEFVSLEFILVSSKKSTYSKLIPAFPVAVVEPYAVEFDKTAVYKTLEAAKGAVKVKKTLDGTVSYLTAGEFTVTETETATNVYTFTVKVGDKVVGTVEGVTITPDVTPGGKTGITGVVRYRRAVGNAYDLAPGALVLITSGKDIVGSAVTGSDGKFEIEVPAGTYRVVVRFALLSADKVTNYANTIITDVAVSDSMVSLVTEGREYIAIEKRLAGDANDDGVVNSNDLNAVKKAISALSK